jgi:hypothetical protein
MSYPIDHVSAQNVAHLTVTITGQNLTAGFNNTLVVTVLNSYYSASYPNTAIYDVDVAITTGTTSASTTTTGTAGTTGVSMYGDSHWHYDSIALGQTVKIATTIFAPSSAIGGVIAGTLTATYKQLGDVSYTQETHSFSMTVYGWINLIIYGVIVTPTVTAPGGNLSISGNLLNGGNLASYNANVSVLSSAIVPGIASSVYIGEVDPNIPRPFSLFFGLKPGLPDGNYTLTLFATAIDTNKPGSAYTGTQTVQVQVTRASAQTQARRPRQLGPMDILLEILRTLYETFFGSPTSTPTFNPTGSNPQGSFILQGYHGVHF